MRARTFSHLSCMGGQRQPREADLPGSRCTHYFLCETNDRLWLPHLPSVRAHLADIAVSLCGGNEFCEAVTRNLVIQPVLVACLKNCTEGWMYKRRLAFDLDADENATMPSPQFVHAQFIAWLTGVFPDVDWRTAQCGIFAGKFADKPASLHVYFPEYCFEHGEHNSFRAQPTLMQQLTDKFAEYNLHIDVSIHTGGLKLPYMDKWLKFTPPRYRNESQQLVLSTQPIETFAELYNAFDPLVCNEDAAWHNMLNFPRLAQRPRIAPPAVVPLLVQPIGEIDHIVRRLYDAVPQWNGVPVTRKQARNGEGLQIIIPQSRYCPLKGADHSNASVAFAVLTTDLTLHIKCHKSNCAGRTAAFADSSLAEPTERAVVDRFNSRFACLQAGEVAQLPQRLADGTMSELRIMTQKQFIDQESRHGEKFGKLCYPRWWLLHEHARRYDMGIICSPTPRDIRFYNTWQSIRRDIAEIAVTLHDKPQAELRELCGNWLRLVENNICDNDADAIQYIFDWFAHGFQRPEVKPGVALVLLGPGGCGKGLTAKALVQIYGPPHGVFKNASELDGNYNSHYAEAAFLFIDEMEKVG